MLEASQYITTVINSKTAISTALTGGLSWEISASGTPKPFMNFNLVENTPTSKDFEGLYTVSFFVFADSLTESATIGKTLKDAIKADKQLRWKYVRSENGYTSNEANEAYIEIVFTFNL